MYNYVFKLISAIQENDTPRQLGFGFALGSLWGMTPAGSLLNIMILILIYLLNVNIGMAVVAAAVYKIFAIVISRFSHEIGYFMLVDLQALRGLWIILYNMMFVPWTKFYNTVVMGNLFIGLVLFVPNYFIGKSFVVYYRKHWRDRIAGLKIIKIIKGTAIYQLYLKYKSFRGKFK